jgi:predicted nucleotidyltransferase
MLPIRGFTAKIQKRPSHKCFTKCAVILIGRIVQLYRLNFLYISIMSLPADVVSKIVQCLIGLNIYKIILFGSYARGTATKDSDIDLVVILDSDEMSQLFKDRMARRRPVSRSLLEINRLYPMDIIVYTKAEYDYLKDKEDFFIQEIEETGRELYGK